MKKTALEILMEYYGVRLEEHFTLVCKYGTLLPHSPFRFTNYGLVDKNDNFHMSGDNTSYLQMLLNEDVTLIKDPVQQVGLTEEEQMFLELSIKLAGAPRITNVEWRKDGHFVFYTQYGGFRYSHRMDTNCFKGLEKHRPYTLKELGLE